MSFVLHACSLSCKHAVHCRLIIVRLFALRPVKLLSWQPYAARFCSWRAAVLLLKPALTPAGVLCRYEPFMVAEASMGSGNQPDAADAARAGSDVGPSGGAAGGRSSFGKLAGYIFGKNQEERKMAMTMPVLSDSMGHMQFYMGSQHQVRGFLRDLQQG